MSLEKDTGAASAAPAQPPAAKLHIPKISLDGAPLSSWTTREDDEYASGSHPASPFYSHPTTKTSYEQLKLHSTSHLSSYETDLEAGSTRPSRECKRESKRVSTRDTMWPQREALVREAKQRKRLRGCYPWNQLSSRQKLIAKIVIALLVIGIGVIIGVTVSMAVHGSYYKGQNQQGPVGTQTQ
jgi:hypothetical protein